MILRAVRISAMAASGPMSTAHLCMKFDSVMVPPPFSPEYALQFPAKATSIRVAENSHPIELVLGWFTPYGVIRSPERCDLLFALRQERGDVDAFEAAKAERHALKGEATVLTEPFGELVCTRGLASEPAETKR